jgi:uncharacterized protein
LGSPSAGRRPRRPAPAPVLVDTNVLLLVVRTGFPLAEEVGRLLPGAALALPATVVAELDGLARSLTPGAAAARALAERYPVVPTDAPGDDGILDAATRTGSPVATADRELRRRLSIRGLTALVPRDRHRLELVRGRPLPPTRRPPVRSSGNG